MGSHRCCRAWCSELPPFFFFFFFFLRPNNLQKQSTCRSFHDYHHQYYDKCFGTIGLLDWLHGTGYTQCRSHLGLERTWPRYAGCGVPSSTNRCCCWRGYVCRPARPDDDRGDDDVDEDDTGGGGDKTNTRGRGPEVKKYL